MRSSASLLLLLAGCGAASEAPRPLATMPPSQSAPERSVPLPPGEEARGPAGTSGAGEARYDEVGYATWYGEELAGSPTASGTPFDPKAITAAHRTLPLGSYAEVTALDSGRTILVLINDRGPGQKDRLIDLSRGAAALLGTGTNPKAPVRVRSASASASEASALAAGRAADRRLDASPALLAALRRQLPQLGVRQPAKRPVPAPAVAANKAPASQGRYIVQVAAFSSEDRAETLAKRLDGRVESGGGLHRVRLGPFRDAAAAQRARDAAARQGYGDAAIIAQPQ